MLRPSHACLLARRNALSEASLEPHGSGDPEPPSSGLPPARGGYSLVQGLGFGFQDLRLGIQDSGTPHRVRSSVLRGHVTRSRTGHSLNTTHAIRNVNTPPWICALRFLKGSLSRRCCKGERCRCREIGTLKTVPTRF